MKGPILTDIRQKDRQQEQLPVGVERRRLNTWGNVLISFDIIEGEHKDFFKADYNAQQEEKVAWYIIG